MVIDTFKLWLTLDRRLNVADVNKIRGCIGNMFWGNPTAHDHGVSYRYVYRYPTLQYKVIDGKCLLVGFREGADIIKEIYKSLKAVNIDGVWAKILCKELECDKDLFSDSSEMKSYKFLQPWIALNEKNYEKYVVTGSWEKRKKLIENILVGNIISMSKSLGYTVKERVNVEIQTVHEIRTSFKDVIVSGFLGNFVVNFNIPNYWGIGKSVSKGFGTVIKN